MSAPLPSLPIYIESYACVDNGKGPGFAEIAFDAELHAQLTRLRELCQSNGLSEARIHAGPEWGPDGIEDELRLEAHELVMTPSGDFWYTANVRHADYRVETRLISIENLVQTVQDAAAAGEPYAHWGDWEPLDAVEQIEEFRAARADTPHP